jgi:hypothetical protein
MSAIKLSEDEIDDLIYFSRAGEKDDLVTFLTSLAEREKVSPAEILIAAKDEGKSTCLHMATGNGHLGECNLAVLKIIFRLLTMAPDVVKFILEQFDSRPKEEKQAYLDAANEFGNTGLHWAALGGHLDTIKLLMDQGASPALANDKNYVPLDLASFNEKFDVVDYFLAKSEGLEGENSEEGFTMSAGDISVKDGDKVEDSEAQAS